MTERAILAAVVRADMALCGALPWAAVAAGAALAVTPGKKGRRFWMKWDRMTRVAAAAAGALVGWLGGWNQMLTVLAAVMAIDYLSGWIVAWCGRSPKTAGGGLSSKAGFVGIAKKGFIMLVVLLATLLDRVVGDQSTVFQSAAACYYIANEGLSILENAGALGVPFPARVKQALETMRDERES